MNCLMNEIVKCFLMQLQTLDSDDIDFFEMAPLSTTMGHTYKLYKKRSSATVRYMFLGLIAPGMAESWA